MTGEKGGNGPPIYTSGCLYGLGLLSADIAGYLLPDLAITDVLS